MLQMRVPKPFGLTVGTSELTRAYSGSQGQDCPQRATLGETSVAYSRLPEGALVAAADGTGDEVLFCSGLNKKGISLQE